VENHLQNVPAAVHNPFDPRVAAEPLVSHDRGFAANTLFQGEPRVKIAVLGTGKVGRALGSRWVKLGHEVIFGSRDPGSEKVREALQKVLASADLRTQGEAAAGAEVVVLATPWVTARDVIKAAGDLTGKVLVDCSNPLNASFSGLDLGHTTSAAEQIAGWAVGARVVKAFNTVSAAVMLNPAFGDQRATMFYCGDDEEAKTIVGDLATQLDLEAVDAGPLHIARYLEPLAMLYIHLAIQEGWGSNCALKIITR
jgi:NADPH-dependent F420 reductase